jgi:TusA-related sulfurtransferase
VLCQQTGHEYLGSEQDGDEWRIGIRVRTAPRRDAD